MPSTTFPSTLPVGESLEQVSSGNAVTIVKLMTNYSSMVDQVIGEFIPGEDRKDLQQEVWIHVAKNLAKIPSDEARIGTWLSGITQRLVNKKMRNRKEDVLFQAEELPEDIAQPAHPNQGEAQLARLEATVKKLSPDQQELAALFINMDSIGEIAQHMGLPEKNVRDRLYRVKKRLKELLKESDSPDSV